MRGTRRFKVKGKLAPRYVGHFQIIDRKGEVAYQIELPPQLSDVHGSVDTGRCGASPVRGAGALEVAGARRRWPRRMRAVRQSRRGAHRSTSGGATMAEDGDRSFTSHEL
jgi:hypothetical protein